MPSAIAHVYQKIVGINRPKITSWPLKLVVGGTGTGPLDDATIALMVGTRLASGDKSNALATLPGADTSPIEAIINFHYHQQGQNVTLERVVINDASTPGPATGPRGIVPLNEVCTSSRTGNDITITAANCAPANIAAWLVKSPALSTLDPGAIFLRCVFLAIDCISGDYDGATLREAAVQPYRTAIDYGLAASRVKGFFNRPIGASTYFQIGQAMYYSKAEYTANPALKGALKVVQAITNMKLENAKPRQVTKGRREQPTPQQVQKLLTKWGVTHDSAALAMLAAPTAPPVDTGSRPSLAAIEAAELAALEFLENGSELVPTLPPAPDLSEFE